MLNTESPYDPEILIPFLDLYPTERKIDIHEEKRTQVLFFGPLWNTKGIYFFEFLGT